MMKLLSEDEYKRLTDRVETLEHLLTKELKLSVELANKLRNSDKELNEYKEHYSNLDKRFTDYRNENFDILQNTQKQLHNSVMFQAQLAEANNCLSKAITALKLKKG